jgi:hypothetical protein
MSSPAYRLRLDTENAVVGRLMVAIAQRMGRTGLKGADSRTEEFLQERATTEHRNLSQLEREAYSKVMVYTDSGGEIQEIRITKVDVAFDDPRILSPGGRLVQSILAMVPGDRAEILVPGGYRSVKIHEVAYLTYSGERTFEMYRHELEDGTVDVPPPSSVRQTFILSPTGPQQRQTVVKRAGEHVITGIAGSGKTGVAVNRMKTVSYKDDEGRAGFQPRTALGLVLTRQLVDYLQKDLADLGMHDLPVKSYSALRENMIQQLGWRVRRPPNRAGPHPYLSSIAWYEYVLAHMTRSLVRGRVLALRAVELMPVLVTALPGYFPTGEAAARLRELTGSRWKQMVQRIEASSAISPEAFLNDAERLAERWCALPPFAGDSEKEHVRRWGSEGLTKAAIQAIRSDFDILELYRAAAAEAVTASGHLDQLAATNPTVRGLGHQLADKTRALSDADLDIALAVHSRLSRDYPAVRGSEKWSSYTHAFIDEFQDFTDVQIDVVRSRVDCKTGFLLMLGDFAQRLGRDTLEASVSLKVEEHFTLNKRQSQPLGAFTALYRKAVVGDHRMSTENPPMRSDVPPYRFGNEGQDEMEALKAELIRLRTDLPEATVAVICANHGLIDRVWACRTDLRCDSIELTRVEPDRTVLIDQHLVYVATPAELKGLEFGVALLVGVDQYDLTDEIGRNMLYVAISRPRAVCGLSWAGPLSPMLGDVARAAGLTAGRGSTAGAFAEAGALRARGFPGFTHLLPAAAPPVAPPASRTQTPATPPQQSPRGSPPPPPAPVTPAAPSRRAPRPLAHPSPTGSEGRQNIHLGQQGGPQLKKAKQPMKPEEKAPLQPNPPGVGLVDEDSPSGWVLALRSGDPQRAVWAIQKLRWRGFTQFGDGKVLLAKFASLGGLKALASLDQSLPQVPEELDSQRTQALQALADMIRLECFQWRALMDADPALVPVLMSTVARLCAFESVGIRGHAWAACESLLVKWDGGSHVRHSNSSSLISALVAAVGLNALWRGRIGVQSGSVLGVAAAIGATSDELERSVRAIPIVGDLLSTVPPCLGWFGPATTRDIGDALVPEWNRFSRQIRDVLSRNLTTGYGAITSSSAYPIPSDRIRPVMEYCSSPEFDERDRAGLLAELLGLWRSLLTPGLTSQRSYLIKTYFYDPDSPEQLWALLDHHRHLVSRYAAVRTELQKLCDALAGELSGRPSTDRNEAVRIARAFRGKVVKLGILGRG